MQAGLRIATSSYGDYYRFGSSTRCFANIDHYVIERMALLLFKRRHSRGYGLKLIIFLAIGSGSNGSLEPSHSEGLRMLLGEGRRQAG